MIVDVTGEMSAGLHYDLGTEYAWDTVPPGATATLTFQGVASASVTRTASTTTTPATWVKNLAVRLPRSAFEPRLFSFHRRF